MEVVPKLVSGVDVSRLALDAKDGFLLSRIDGHTSASLLAEVVGMSEATVAAALERLERLGAVHWRGGEFDAVDLPADERERILVAERDLDKQTHWQVLGLSGEVTAADVKRAYFEVSKVFHPDKYFRRNIGPFRDKLNRIFQAAKQAYEVLADDAQRLAYAKGVPAPQAVGPVAPVRTGPTDAELEARRQEIIAERKKKRAPQRVAQPEKAREHYQKGLSQMSHGDLVAAAQSFKLALQLEPENADYGRLHDEVQRGAGLTRSKRLAEQAEELAAQGKNVVAAQGFAQAFALSPEKLSYAVRAAEEFLRARDLPRAWQHAELALNLSPKRADARLIAARTLEAKGDLKGALAQLGALVGLEAADPRVTDLRMRLVKAGR
jgi:tetratricopeptide (TPR) repeat protein